MHLNMRFQNGKAKALTLSYDDGVIHDKRLIDILNRYGLKATFNLNSGIFGQENMVKGKDRGRMKLDEAKNVYINSGHEIASHTYTHPFITDLRYNDMLYEVLEDKKCLEKEFGCIVRGYAAPYGCCSDELDGILRSIGIVYQRTVDETLCMELPQNWMRLQGTCHHNNPKLMELARSLAKWQPNHTDKCRMFYVWGHSYEFDDNDNWNVIEDFAKYIGGRDDIWYAVNIEIYEYVQAFKNLHTDTMNKIIYNSSALSVWFEKNRKLYEVKSGETIYLE